MPPRLARLLAVVAAVVLVVVAFLVRGAVTGDDDGEDVTAGSGATSPERGDEDGGDGGPFQVLCDEDLGEEVCDLLADHDDVDRVELVRRSEVAELVADPDAGWDAWLTLDPMPALLDATRRFDQGDPDPLTDVEDSVPVASSDLAVLAPEDSRLECLAATTDWACLTSAINPPVLVAHPSTSVGAVTLAAGAAALVGSDDFSSREFDESGARDALERLVSEGASKQGRRTDEQTGALLRPGTGSAAITTADLADRRADTPQGRGRGLRTLQIAPQVRIGVVLAGLGDRGSRATDALEEHVTGQTVRDALARAGWAGDPGPTVGVPAAPDLIYAIVEELS